MSGWIDCRDQMPADGQKVLMAGLLYDKGPDFWQETATFHEIPQMYVDAGINCRWWNEQDEEGWLGYAPTHWMPLMDPPQFKQQEIA